MSPTIAEISPKSAAESPQAVPEAIPSLDQRYQVVCRVLQIETSSSEDRFLTLLRQLKSKLLNGQQVLYVMHQLFLARIPTQEELENLTLYLDHHSESEVIAQLHNCEEFRFGPQSYTRFEAVPQDQLLVDVSHTLRFSHNSGIQRVVRSLSTRLQSQQLPHQFIELDQTLGVDRLVDSETAELLSNWEQVDPATGKVVYSIQTNYACCRFTMSEPYVLGANMDMIDLSQEGKLVSTGPAIDSRECLGAVVSNGRIFYTSQASGFIVSQTYGPESKDLPPAWEVREAKQ